MAQNMGGTGMYQLACEASPHKDQIDIWLNENKPNKFISDSLREMGDEFYISTNSIAKYRQYREDMIKEELEELPEFKAKKQEIQAQLNASVGKVQVVDLIGRLGNVIEDSAVLLQQAKYDDIRINNVKDLRMVQQTMIEAVKVYSETMLNAQKFKAIEDNPDLLTTNNTTININIKNALSDILKGAITDGGDGFGLIDRLRSGIGKSN
jgi:predicted peroxiredoxin